MPKLSEKIKNSKFEIPATWGSNKRLLTHMKMSYSFFHYKRWDYRTIKQKTIKILQKWKAISGFVSLTELPSFWKGSGFLWVGSRNLSSACLSGAVCPDVPVKSWGSSVSPLPSQERGWARGSPGHSTPFYCSSASSWQNVLGWGCLHNDSDGSAYFQGRCDGLMWWFSEGA